MDDVTFGGCWSVSLLEAAAGEVAAAQAASLLGSVGVVMGGRVLHRLAAPL
jgi:ClpP class serine protease